MTNIWPPERSNGRELTPSDVKKGAALAVTMVWLLALLFFGASLLAYWITGSPYGRQFATLISLLVLFVTTPIVLIFVLPAVIKTRVRQPHATAEPRASEQTKSGAPLFPSFIKNAAIAGAMTWALSLLALLTAKSFGDELAAFVFLALSTAFLVLFVLPASIIRYARRR